MKSRPFLAAIVMLLLFSSCKKIVETVTNNSVISPKTGEFYQYVIRQGQHYTDNNNFQRVEYDELKFTVKFDSTSIYQTIDPANQEDINKLYGFSDNNSTH